MNARRTTREVLEDHLNLARGWDFETDLVRNFSENTVLLTSYGIFKGYEGIRRKVRLLAEHLPDGQWTYRNILTAGDIGFLEWSGVGSNGSRVEDGADSYLIRDGRIQIMTIHYTVIAPR